jgi:AcrR family transcriptional regulator
MPASLPRPRGRPVEVDRRHVALVALRLFERQGFDLVTMDEVAEAASVSRRTCFRLFPSKADLVWDGLAELLEVLKPRVAALAGKAMSPVALLEEVFLESLRTLDDPAVAKEARRRLRLIAASPGLLNHHTLEELQSLVRKLIGDQESPGDPPSALVAQALVAVGFSAVLWWAQQDGAMSAADAFRASLQTVARYAAETR